MSTPREVIDDGDGVTPGKCLKPVPALTCAAGSCPAGCEAQGKARGSPFRPGITGEGKAGWVNASESLLMLRERDIPGRVVVLG